LKIKAKTVKKCLNLRMWLEKIEKFIGQNIFIWHIR